MVPPASHRVSRVPWYSGAARPASDFVYGAFTLCGGVSQTPSTISHCTLWRSTTPACMHTGLGSLPFARRYLGDRCFFLFLCLLRCFSSAAYLPYVMDWRMDVRSLSVRVSPFRNPRITDHVHLPAAYRSLSRLSSAQSAKASAPRPSSLDHVSSLLSSPPGVSIRSLTLFVLGHQYIAIYTGFFACSTFCICPRQSLQ